MPVPNKGRSYFDTGSPEPREARRYIRANTVQINFRRAMTLYIIVLREGVQSQGRMEI